MNQVNLRKCLVASVALAVFSLGAPSIGSAQFDPGRALREARDRARRAAEAEAGRAADSINRATQGVRFEVKIKNPTRSPLYYNFNGQPQIALMPGYTRTHSGVGSPSIRFDNGAGQDVDYALNPYQSYTFQRRGQVLQLYQD